MTNANITTRLRYNYVLAELDSLLFEGIVGHAIVTEDFVHRGYEERFGKILMNELSLLGSTLQQLIEHEFGTDLLWITAFNFKGIIRRSSVNSPAQVYPEAEARKANEVQFPKLEAINAMPVQMVGVPTRVAWKDGQRVQQLVSYLRENETLVDDSQLIEAREALRIKPLKERVRIAINLVEFYALSKFGGDLMLEHFHEVQQQSGDADFERGRFGPEIKGLRLRIVNELFENYGYHHVVLGVHQNCNVTEQVACGGGLHFPNLPTVTVFVRKAPEPGSVRPLKLAAMERLVIVEEKELIFTSIRLARKRQAPQADAHDVKTGHLIEI
ncbi:hypothetical protein AAVH_09310 [Aphelenchoides avenae]|nr:hypothetical protein AAVH_09310 [Aphelenchus avenae]